MTHDGRGVVDSPGKKVFVAGALAGETVSFQRRRKRRNYDEAELLEVLEASPSRIDPRCAVFGRCGGCVMQHIDTDAQRALKQQALVDSLARIGKVEPLEWLEPVGAPDSWHYRRRARLAVKDVAGKGRVLVGFREQHAPFITDMHRCEVLKRPVDDLIDPLSELIGQLSTRSRLPQIEVAVADNATELVFRVLESPTEDDLDRLREFGETHGLRIVLQPGGLDSITAVYPDGSLEPLHYELGDLGNLGDPGIRVEFEATDFVQINPEVNRRMVARAIELLDVDVSHRVLDLYCGIGNFTLPLARRAGAVVGVEGEERQVARARRNATINGIDNVAFLRADLNRIDGREPWLTDGCDRLLLDPARSGAEEIVRHVGVPDPERIVYVSCHPGTLARDANELVTQRGYRLDAAGIIDMFPHTAHVESIAVFQKTNKNK